MGSVVGGMAGSKSFLTEYLIDATVVRGQALMASVTAGDNGEAITVTTTASANMLGLAEDASLLDTTPAQEPGRLLVVAAGGLENLVRIDVNPLAIYRFAVSGSSVAGTALVVSTTTPANILSNDTADTTAPFSVITDTAVGTITMAGGLIKGRGGNNTGAVRTMNAQSDNVSTTVGIGFVNSIAVGDTFIRTYLSRKTLLVDLCAELTEVDGILEAGVPANTFRVLNVIIDEERDLAWVDVLSGDHMFNDLS